MLLRLLPLICTFAAAAAQQTYYCNSFAGVIRDSDFYLVTRNQTDTSYPPGLSCEFNAESSSAAFLIEIQTFDTHTAVLTVNSMSNTLFRGSQLAGDYQKAIATPSSNLRVRFDATGDYSYYRSGVRLRVRAFDTVGCPPNWQYLYGNCYGTSTAPGLLNYTDAQKACNSMRSNLLHLPSNYAGSLTSFRNMLNSNLRRDYTWIGLTDRTTRYRHTWLNSVRQNFTSDISCFSGGASTTCFLDERCGTFSGKASSFYAIYMDRCSKIYDYACSMPPGGTGNFYSVPYQTDSSTVSPRTNTYNVDSDMIFVYIVVSIGIFCIILAAIYGGLHCILIIRAACARNAILSAGRVSVPPLQPGFQMQVQQSAAVNYPPPQAVPPPPAYDVAVDGGYPGNVNMGYAK